MSEDSIAYVYYKPSGFPFTPYFIFHFKEFKTDYGRSILTNLGENGHFHLLNYRLIEKY